MNMVEATKVLSTLKERTRVRCMKCPSSFSAAILSEKSGIIPASGSFLSIQAFHKFSFLCMLSGNSLKNGIGSYPNVWRLKASTFIHVTSSLIHVNGLARSALESNAAPDFKNIETSLPEIFWAVYRILKHIIKINVNLSFSNNPLFT